MKKKLKKLKICPLLDLRKEKISNEKIWICDEKRN
jgi:hypothetical protein